jgi:hypothetical protein
VIGAFIVNLAKSFFTVTFPEYWLFFLGAICSSASRSGCRDGVVGCGCARRCGASCARPRGRIPGGANGLPPPKGAKRSRASLLGRTGG